MSSPLDNSMDIDHQESHLGSHESNQDASFDPAKFDSAVLDAIQEFKKSSTVNPPPFQFRDKHLDDLGILLFLVIKTFLRESQTDVDMCKQHLLESFSLFAPLKTAYTSRSFASLLSNDAMPPEVIERAPKQEQGITPSSSGGTQDFQIHGSPLTIQSAFKDPYVGNSAQLLIETLDAELGKYSRNTAAESPYNWTISIVQSSGMGKSRMVEEAGNTVFTIPINLREEAAGCHNPYPPPDINIREFFTERRNDDDKKQQVDYAIFLRVMFDRARESVQSRFGRLTGHNLASAWAAYLGEGQTESVVGVNRKQLYNRVVEKATKISKDRSLKLVDPDYIDDFDNLVCSLQASCDRFVKCIQPDASANENACFMYFDEAHSLSQAVEHSDVLHKRNPFHNLGKVLSKLINYPVFFIFLSTNSNLRGFAPPASHYPSDRDIQGSQLIPPFTELPFDIHESKVQDKLRLGSMTLDRVCRADMMVCFGRPLWSAQYKITPAQDIFRFAMNKLAGNGPGEHKNDSILAALGVRIGIAFDETFTYAVQSKLVESHMRVAYSIPEHRTYMHTGAPSEPILAEAAGRYLSSDSLGGIQTEGPSLLSMVAEKGFLARGERGEIVGRLLVTAAHDIALGPQTSPITNQPSYHRPIPVMHFLRALFHPDHHSTIRDAECLTRRKDIELLGQAFANSYVFFSHFALAEDSRMLSTISLATALLRGMAIQAKDGQTSIDAVIPIHMGGTNTPIMPKTTSAINLQIKNRKGLSDCDVDRSITVPAAEMPVISIVFELGVTGKKAGTVVVSEKVPPETRNSGNLHINDHHYKIVASGCSPMVFAPVTAKTEPQYKAILGAMTVLENFHRCDMENNIGALQAMRPAFSGERQDRAYAGKFPS